MIKFLGRVFIVGATKYSKCLKFSAKASPTLFLFYLNGSKRMQQKFLFKFSFFLKIGLDKSLLKLALSLSLFLSAAAFQSRHFSCRCQLQRRPDVVVVAKSANASIASCLSQNRLFGPLMLYFFPPAFVLKTECIFREFLSLSLSFYLLLSLLKMTFSVSIFIF